MTDQTPGHTAAGEPNAEPNAERDEAQLRQLFADYSTQFEPDQAKISSQIQERLQSAETNRAVLDAKPMGLAVVAMAVAVVVSVVTLIDGPWADQRVRTVDGVGIAEPAAGEGIDGVGPTAAQQGDRSQLDSSQGLAGNEERTDSTGMAAFAPSTSTLLVEQEGDTPLSTVLGPPAGVGSSVGTETVPSTVGAGSPSPSTTDPTAGAGSPPSSAVTSSNRSSTTSRSTTASTASTTSTTAQPTNTNSSETRPRPFETRPPVISTTTAPTSTLPTTRLTTSTTASTTTSTSLPTTTSSSTPSTTTTAAPIDDLQLSTAALPSRIRFSEAGYIDWAIAGSRNDGKIITLDDRDPSIRISAPGHDPDRKPAPIEILWTDGQSEEDRDINDTWWSTQAFPTVFVISNNGDESPESIQLYVGGSADLSVSIIVGKVGTKSISVPSPGRVVTVDLGPQAQNNPFVITVGAPFGSGTVALGAVALR